MAPAYVNRTFSRDLKISLSAYITRLRIERAKLLLMETNMRIAEIAVSVGIVNRDYFSVLFKKKYRHASAGISRLLPAVELPASLCRTRSKFTPPAGAPASR